MCALCTDEIIKNLNIIEIKNAASELINSSSSEEEKEHVKERLKELEQELDEND